MNYPIYTEKRECRDCYKCVRQCPVKAIRVKKGSAVVDHDLCIFCGRCVTVCPAGAKKVRDDLPRARQLLKTKERVYLSVAPSFFAEFGDEADFYLHFLKSAGVTGISETALGAQALSRELERLYHEGHRGISGACPAVVEWITKYYPSLTEYLLPAASPMILHGRQLRSLYGESIGVIFIGPCVGKKLESDRDADLINVALTFDELRRWQREEPASGRTIPSHPFDEFLPGRGEGGTLYPVNGGLCETLPSLPRLSRFSFSGPDTLFSVFEELRNHPPQTPCLIECLLCPEGCVNGPGMTQGRGLFSRRQTIRNVFEERRKGASPGETGPETPRRALPEIDGSFLFQPAQGALSPPFSSREIEGALRELGKGEEKERLNCGACGYNSCRDFAVAYLLGMSEKEMCAGNMRKLAQKKVTALMKTIPLGVVIVDRGMQIVECNHRFIDFFSETDLQDYEGIEARAEGRPVDAFIPLSPYLASVFENSLIPREERIEYNNAVYHSNLFIIEKGRLAGAVLQDVTHPTVRRQTIIKKAEHVIRKNLESVQQIASLLGENAAETEIVLNSVIEAMQTAVPEKGD